MDRDPFSNTADVDAYVPRTATEYALVSLEMALRDGARVVCLTGPAGSGKSLLLRVLEERVADDFASLRVPYSKLDPDELCRWALDALGEEAVEDPERALAARITRGADMGDPPLLWMIDDADLLPIPTLQTLLALQRSSGEALQLLLASSSELPSDEFTQAGVRPVKVELEGEMDSDEMANYVRARLDRAGADPAERAQIEASLDRLFARSQGNPGRLHAAAAALLCFGPDRIGAPAESDAGERVSIESLVAEAVASEPLEEGGTPAPPAAPTTALVVPATSESDAAASDPPQSDLAAPAPRKRHRLRRLGRR